MITLQDQQVSEQEGRTRGGKSILKTTILGCQRTLPLQAAVQVDAKDVTRSVVSVDELAIGHRCGTGHAALGCVESRGRGSPELSLPEDRAIFAGEANQVQLVRMFPFCSCHEDSILPNDGTGNP